MRVFSTPPNATTRVIRFWTGGVTAPGIVLIHVNIFVYALAYWLTSPMLPFLLKEHGATSLSLGMFQSLFSIVQLGGGLTVGFVQDRTSSSAALSVTQLGSTLVYTVLFFADSLEMLYLSRLPTVLQQSMQVAQAYVSKASTPSSRAVAFSRLSVSYAAGMIVGSYASGVIAEALGTKSVMLLAALLSALIVLVNAVLLPSTPASADVKDTAAVSTSVDRSINGYWSMFLSLKKTFIFLAMVFITRSVFEPVFTLQLIDRYNVQKAEAGALLATASVIGMITNVALLPALLKLLSEQQLQRSAILIGALAYSVLTFTWIPYYFFVGVSLTITAAASLLYTTTTSYLTSRVPSQSHGQAVASAHALRSLVGIAGPVVGTGLLELYGAGAVAAVDAVLLGLSLLFM